MAPKSNIVLVGFMGSGKSKVGRLVAQATGREFIDTDRLVEDEAGPIPEIFASEGEAGFRKRERRAIQKAVRASGAVIATGGGAVLDETNVARLRRSGVVVYLKVGTDELTRRLRKSGNRPLLGPSTDLDKRIDSLVTERAPKYQAAADHVVVSNGRAATRTAEAVVAKVAREATPKPRSRTVRVNVPAPYNVNIGSGTLADLAKLAKLPRQTQRVCVVSHPRIKRLWGRAVGKGLPRVSWFTFPEGEANKSLETAHKLLAFLATQGFHRDDALIALGGGVVGDLTGFAAATYARGIAYVQVPTTLLAMVDASIGGKTGVNLPQGKNLVGSFHQPRSVVADLDVLKTLPDRELRGGLAEVIKSGFIAEPGLVAKVTRSADSIFTRDNQILGDLVLRSARIKARVVAGDEREQGRRMILNYGHTMGHALEAHSLARRGGRKLHHGEAISIGMVFAAWVSALSGRVPTKLVVDHRDALAAVGLPVRAKAVRYNDVRRYMELDKKHKGGVRMVLLDRAGKPVVTAVDERTLRDAFARVSG